MRSNRFATGGKKTHNSRFAVLLMTLLFVMSLTTPVYAVDNSNSSVIADFDCKFGDVKLRLESGFDFIEKGSQEFDLNLALTGAVLSQQMYYGSATMTTMKEIGYDYTAHYEYSGLIAYEQPTMCFGYKELVDENGDVKNVFAISIEGTSEGIDWITDILDGGTSMFADTAESAEKNFKKFLESDGVNKTESQLKQEDTFIFITGHSLGGAVANCLSVSDYITSLVNENENRIYTYTFEAPHTCVNLWWMDVAGMSNAYNYKNSNDIVTYLPPYFGSTTYGKDVEFSVAELNYGVFDTLFPDAEGDSFDALGGVENLHQIALDLVYIIQQGINEGYWDSVDDVIADESETTQTETVLNIETGEFNEETFNTSGVMQWEDFASTYPAIVDSYGFSGDYTEKMNIALFELQDDDGNLLEEKALFNPTGFGDDPFEWGKEYGGVTYQSSEEFEADEFYIRYQEIVAVGSADGDRFIYVINESANESTSQYDGYAGIVASMIEQYGALHFIEDEYGSECYAAGLIYAGLVDFDADGLDELFIVHTDPQDQNSCHPVAEVYATGEGASGNNVPTQNFYGKLRDISYEATCTFDLVQQDGKIYLPTMSLESGITSLYGFTSAGSGTYDSVREFSGNEFYDQKTSGAYADYLSIPYYVAARPEEGYEERKNDMEQTLTSAMNEILSTLGVE